MGQGVVAPQLPLLLHDSRDLAWDSGVSASLMYLGIFVSTYFYGLWADRGFVHRLLGPGLISYFLILLALGGAGSKSVFFILRALEGLSLSAIFVSADFVLGRLSAPHERSRWLSYYGVAISIGLLLGPALSLGLSEYGVAPFFSLSLVAAVSLFLGVNAFSFRLDRCSDPLKPSGRPELLQRGPYSVATAYGFMESGLVACLPILAAQYFKIRPELGLMVIIITAGVSSFFWGVLADRYGPRSVVQGLLLGLTLGAALFWIVSGVMLLHWVFYLSCILFGAVAGGLYPIGFSWLLEGLSEERFGEASGAFARYYGLGSLLGPLSLGWAVDRWEVRGMFFVLSTLGFVSGMASIFATRRILSAPKAAVKF